MVNDFFHSYSVDLCAVKKNKIFVKAFEKEQMTWAKTEKKYQEIENF